MQDEMTFKLSRATTGRCRLRLS